MALIHKRSRIITFIVLVLAFSSVFQLLKLNIGIWWFLWSTVILVFYLERQTFRPSQNEKLITVVWLFLTCNIISIIRGFFIADNYWESKTLVNSSLIMLFPLSIFVTQGKYFGQLFLRAYIRYGIPIFITLFVFFQPGMTGYFLAPISVLILFYKTLSFKWKTFVIILSAFVFFTDLNARSNIIKFLLPYLIMIFFSFKIFRNIFFFNFLNMFLLLFPFIMVLLYFSANFNIFDFKKYTTEDYQVNTSKGKANLLADTRTGVYDEVISSAIKYNYLWTGRSPARGYYSKAVGVDLSKKIGLKTNERYGSEVSILNILTWTGLIGVILYFSIFLVASHLAINQSNSVYLKIIGIYISFRWLYGWVEDFSRFDLFQICLWLLIGICFSRDFRKLKDAQFEVWIRSIFSKSPIIFD